MMDFGDQYFHLILTQTNDNKTLRQQEGTDSLTNTIVAQLVWWMDILHKSTYESKKVKSNF